MTTQVQSSSGASISITGLLTRGSTQFGLLIILSVLWTVFASLSPGFLSTFNLNSLGRSVAVDVVVGFAQMVVLATGGMNLSVGAIGVCSVMLAGYFLQVLGLPIPLAIAGTLAFGGVLGWLNGIAISHGVPLNGLPSEIGAFGKATVGPVPALAVVALAIGGLLYILFAHSVLGRQILSVGANSRAAEMSGIPVSRVIVFVHVLSGVLAAAAALMLTARLGAAMPAVAGDDWLLPSFLAPVIGGTSLAGGAASVIGTILGALLVSTIRSGLLILQFASFWLQFFLGVFLLAAILLERYRSVLSAREQTRQA
jgi:ribose transport system permease protein